MFGWFKKQPKPTPANEKVTRFEHHFAAAEGSTLQRATIAAAMSAIEDDLVQEQLVGVSSEMQMIFMMTYECFVLWALKGGMQTVLKPEVVASAVEAIHQHFAKHAWYKPHAFEKIWEAVQIAMPEAMKPRGGFEYPLADLLMAAQVAGYPIDGTIGNDMKLGIHVVVEFGRLLDVARVEAKEHLKLSQK